MVGTIVGAFEQFYKEAAADGGADWSDINGTTLLLFRAWLKGNIRRGWTKLNRSAALLINDVGCRDDLRPPHLDADGFYQQELKRDQCGRVRNCGLKQYVANGRPDFERLRDTLLRIKKPDQETATRIRALRQLYRVPKTDFLRADCYACGDPIIVHECPNDCVLVSKNRQHIEPICFVFNKTAVYHS